MRDNPAQQWADLRQEVMDRLKGENEALIKRLRELEERGVKAKGSEGGEEGAKVEERGVEVEGQGRGGEDLVPRESWEVVQTEKTELEEIVKQKEKRLLRLQQV
jgi:mitotic spindle assembly checkpoint protein MAD1